ncbi:MAG: glucose-1-phosphate cytidylyltransferase [Alphaproteobacteria bacterium]|nr:glucose-1-phosphate cytidylyltransferase [Alphaproteobacteria bacterium]
MKAVILAGGRGTRIAEESDNRPKPMVEIGGKPLLWHVMQSYSRHGVKDFVICLGYKGYVIKEFFFNYYRHMSDITVNLKNGELGVLNSHTEDWNVTLIDTGEETLTGGRLKRVAVYLGNEDFCMTYGDGVADVDIRASIEFHRKHGKLATVTSVQPPGRFGVMKLGDTKQVTRFEEKPQDEMGWINGGFFVLSPGVMDYIEDDRTSWEREPLTRLAKDGQLMAFPHHGFWQACDTLRDKRALEDLWKLGQAPWLQ